MSKITTFPGPYMQPARRPPLPAVAQSTSPILELRAQCAAAVADYRRGQSSDPITDEDRLEALAVLERLMDLHGDERIRTYAWNLCAARRRRS